MKALIITIMKKNHQLIGDEYLGPIAHRGLHNNEITENGLKAFELAIEKGFAFELDVHITKDLQLLVCHDDDLKRTTGKEGIIEDLTFDEIRQGYRLLDGGVIPSFQEVLDLNKEKRLIVVELKVHQKNFTPLAKATMQALAQIKDKKKIVLISFDPRALLLVKNKGFGTGLLICKEHEWTWLLRGLFDSIDIEQCMVREKRVSKYHKKHIVNTWTVETPEDMAANLPFADAQTFQHIDPAFVKDFFTKNK